MRCSNHRFVLAAIGLLVVLLVTSAKADVTISGNQMWNDKVYISWQNITHVYEPNSTNMVIDTWKVDDNGNGDPRDDQNRILHNGQTDGAFGITASGPQGLGGPYTAGVSAATTHMNPDGSGTLVMTAQDSRGLVTASYTMLPDSDILLGHLEVQANVAGTPQWGISMISSVWVDNSPGEMAIYNSAALDEQQLSASTTWGNGTRTQGIDYLESDNLSTGWGALYSSDRNWSLSMSLTSASVPADLRTDLTMHSQYGGWGFDRNVLATPAETMSPGQTMTFDAVFEAGSVPEPSTFVLLGVAAVGLLGYAWRRRRRTA